MKPLLVLGALLATASLATAQSDTHNPNGDLTSIGTNVYRYDFDDRLVSLSESNTSGTFVYNGLGNRLARTVSGNRIVIRSNMC